jgi:hypothetical protein
MSEKINDGKVIGDSKVEQVSGGYEEPSVQYNGADAQTEGVLFVPVFSSVNANLVTITDTLVNININQATNPVMNPLMNIITNVNTNAMINANANTGE